MLLWCGQGQCNLSLYLCTVEGVPVSMAWCSDVADGGDSLHHTAFDSFVLLYLKGSVVCDILTAVLWKMENSSLLICDAVYVFLQTVADV
jgi:hypothetical protein